MTRNLPDELIARIIDCNESTADVATCRLVCKHWNHLAEPLMFGKQINIKSEADALSLYGHLFRKPYYGKLVKRIHFKQGEFTCALHEGLLHHIFTPNMEEMRGELVFGHEFFNTIIKMARKSETKFEKLQVLPHPLYFSNVYDDALLTFRDTLREVTLVLDADRTLPRVGILIFLTDFKSLAKLTLNGTLASMFFMEDVLEHCTALEELTLNLQFADNIHEKTFVETWATPIVKTVDSVKKVTFEKQCRSDQLEYIRFKYPRIDTLIIDVHTAPLMVTRNNIKRIVQAMMGVSTYNIKLLVKEENITDTFTWLFNEDCQFDVKQADQNHFTVPAH
ncbi:hypothetical protein MBANPS3_004463 [Mucor bainieri]